ncbi:MlaD family protein [Variovorax sp. PCZ-1]|uniref:MlaD family protein n=1 Tax=Variovorax sp. PCZ-1 TaxID=2835533 RepID=UPI001BCF02D7|nr:MlaD family protein [Variovorax sp. PCZ-1]MBS7809122.1 MCE family protein [Variovorax sp. PCZ-1]
MENKSHALAAGAFVILVTALLVALAAWLMRDTRIRDTLEFSTRESVTGLQPQAAVRYRGIAVGKVDSIEFDPKQRGNVLVSLAINQGTPITKSTYAVLGYQGVTGLAYVQLDDDGSSNEVLDLSGSTPPRILLKPSLLSKLSDQGANILIQVEETTKRLNQLLAPENQKALIGSVQAVGASAANFSNQVTAMQKILDAQFGPERTDIPALVKDTRQTMQAMQATAAELSKTAKDTSAAAASVGQVSQRVAEKGGTLDRVNEGLSSANTAAQAIGQSAQALTANTLPRATRMTDDAARAARATDRVVKELGDNPQSLIFGNAPVPPGPGERGFTPPTTAPVK